MVLQPRENKSPETVGDRQPLVANFVTFRVTPQNGASSNVLLDSSCSSGAQGLMTSFASLDTNPKNLVCSMRVVCLSHYNIIFFVFFFFLVKNTKSLSVYFLFNRFYGSNLNRFFSSYPLAILFCLGSL